MDLETKNYIDRKCDKTQDQVWLIKDTQDIVNEKQEKINKKLYILPVLNSVLNSVIIFFAIYKWHQK